jgi:hypothetical protein
MNNSAVIRDVGLTIANVLSTGLKAHGAKANVLVGPPQRGQFDKRLPALGVSLLSVDAFQRPRRPEDVSQEAQTDGSIREYYVDAPLDLELEYLLTSWAKELDEEAVLLGTGMKVLLECPLFEKQHIVGDSFAEEDRVQLVIQREVPLERRMMLFQGFGEPLRGAAFYSVPVLLYSERKSAEIKRVISRHVGITDRQSGRRMR